MEPGSRSSAHLPNSRFSLEKPGRTSGRARFDRAWLAVALLFLLGLSAWLVRGQACDFLATDFRGYYAAGLIAREAGLAAVYDPERQTEAQDRLLLECLDGTARATRLNVLVPYLPVFSQLFLILPALDFTTSYAAWSLFWLVIFILYLCRFSMALCQGVDWLKLAQWALCFPLLANLFLGQINVLLVIALGEFFLASRRDRPLLGGAWLALLLLKPHVLILLLPGLLISRRWKALLGFGSGATLIFIVSLLLAGTGGFQATLAVVRSFAEASFHSVPDMMNARGLAFNLGRALPDWVAWLAAVGVIVVTAWLVLPRWAGARQPAPSHWLMLATLAGTCVVAWHANLYLWLILVPFLLALDLQNRLPLVYLAGWAFGPLVVFALAHLVSPALAQPALATAMLAANLAVVVDSGRQMKVNV